MRKPRTVPFVVTVGVIGFLTTSAAADTPFGERPAEAADFSLGIGYAHFSIGDSDSALEGLDMVRLEASATMAPLPRVPQLRLGAALGFGFVVDNASFVAVSDEGLFAEGSGDIPLWALEPELRLSWRQHVGDRGLFVEPGVGVGAVFARISLDTEDTDLGDPYDEWEEGLSARAFLNVGFEVAGGMAGLQFSYMRGEELDFAPNAGGDVEEFYVGLFGSIRF